MAWYDFLKPKKNIFELDPKRGKFCGWQKIREGLIQSKEKLPEITVVAKKIAKIIAKVVKVIGWALGSKYLKYGIIIGEAIEIQLKLGTKIVNGEITPEEAGEDLDKWLTKKGLTSSTIRHLIHLIAKIVTSQLEKYKK